VWGPNKRLQGCGAAALSAPKACKAPHPLQPIVRPRRRLRDSVGILHLAKSATECLHIVFEPTLTLSEVLDYFRNLVKIQRCTSEAEIAKEGVKVLLEIRSLF
jgi:hypothetical protein